MKKIIFIFVLGFAVTFVYGDTGTIQDAATATVQSLTNDTTAQIVIPPGLNPSSLDSLMQWWVWLGGILTPFLLLILNRFWPSYSKKELILKTSIGGLVIIWAIILLAGGGFNTISGVSALIMFIIKVLTYDKFINPIGLKSYKAYKT